MNAEHVKVLEELDALLDMQGRLLFSRENYNEVEAERFGVMLLDFMRRHGVMVRAAIAALKAEKPGWVLVPVEPTLAMFRAQVEWALEPGETVDDAFLAENIADFRIGYAAMLAAAQESANG